MIIAWNTTMQSGGRAIWWRNAAKFGGSIPPVTPTDGWWLIRARRRRG